jgi:hypothetical protein
LFFDDSHTRALLSTQILARIEARSKGERREELLGARRLFSLNGGRIE